MRNKDKPSQIKPYLLVICAAVLWASAGTASKYLFNRGINPYVLVQSRVTFSALLVLAYLLVFKTGLLKIKVRDLWYFIPLGALGFAGVQVTYLVAISKIKVAIAILLQYLTPFFVAVYSYLFLKERMDRWKVISLFLAFTGCFFAVEAYRASFLSLNLQGVIAGLLSAVFFSFYSLLGERVMHRYSPWSVLFYAFVFAALILNIVLHPKNLISWGTELRLWFLVLYIASCGTVLPFGFYFMGIEHLRTTRASIVATLEPISAGLLSFIFVHEFLTPWQIFGGLLVIISIIIIQSRREVDLEAPVYKKKVLQHQQER
ncbi:MAG TPA: EamA family transporter [Desulfatiglandales bacterium]|nr:EamA family transporter [Desulfatiglandales bacterium]